jgi:hypothetical protein
MRIARIVAVVCLVVGGVIAVPFGQAQRPPASMEDLLTEVRELRAELNQAAGTSMRMQLLLARLQLQEQRVTTAARQLTEVRQLLTTKQSGQVPAIAGLTQLEEASRRGLADPAEQKAVEQELPRARARVAQMQREEQELRTQEAELAGVLASEQGRWLDFNSRLDDLERALPAGPAR